MVTTVQIYKTSDGKKFEDANLAAAHEASLKHKASIENFLDKHYPQPAAGQKAGPARAIAGRAIALWLSAQDAEAAEE